MTGEWGLGDRTPALAAGPGVFRRHKEQLMSSIDENAVGPPPGEHPDPAMYPRLAYLDEVAALEYLKGAYGFRRYEADDPEANHWHFHESLDHVRARGGQVDE
jgi:hypothetical protein